MLNLTRSAVVSALTGAALLGIASNAAADCADPFDCICMGTKVVAAEVSAVDASEIELTIFAVAATESTFVIGDKVSVSADHALQLGERRFVVHADDSPWVRFEVPDNDEVQCIDASFTLQQTLNFTNGENCRDKALAASGQTFEDLPACNDNVGFFCTAAKAAPTPGAPWYALGLALLGGVLAVRRRKDPSAAGPR